MAESAHRKYKETGEDFKDVFLCLSVIQQCSFVLSQNGTVRSIFINFIDSTKTINTENKA